MSNNPITMLQIRRILQLSEEGRSKREISRVMHCSRHTVDAYVNKLPPTPSLVELSRLPDAELSKLFYNDNTTSKPDSRYEYLSSKLDYYNKELKRTGVTKQTLWLQYREQVPNGYEYVRFCQHIKEHTRINGATMHFKHQAGDRVQIDFAGKPLSYLDSSTGELVSCPVLVCVLAFSTLSYHCASLMNVNTLVLRV